MLKLSDTNSSFSWKKIDIIKHTHEFRVGVSCDGCDSCENYLYFTNVNTITMYIKDKQILWFSCSGCNRTNTVVLISETTIEEYTNGG